MLIFIAFSCDDVTTNTELEKLKTKLIEKALQ